MDTQREIQFQLERREQLVRHIAMLYMMRRDVTAMVEDTEKEIDIIDRHIAYLQSRMAKGDVKKQKELLEQWKASGEYSTNMGSRVHYL